jgi:hypothetical protein
MDRAVGRALFPSPFQGRGHRACRRLGRTASAPAHGALADRSPPAPAPPRCPKRPFTRQPGRHRRRPRRSRFYRSRLYNGPACTPSLRGAQPLATQSGAWLPCTTCTYMHMHVHAHARTCTCTYMHMHRLPSPLAGLALRVRCTSSAWAPARPTHSRGLVRGDKAEASQQPPRLSPPPFSPRGCCRLCGAAQHRAQGHAPTRRRSPPVGPRHPSPRR